jgi:hypothetical protein
LQAWRVKYDHQRHQHQVNLAGDLVMVPGHAIKWHDTEHGKYRENRFIMSLNGQFQDEVLNEVLFWTLTNGRAQIVA